MSLFGKLDLSAVPTHEPIIMGTLAVVVLLGAALLGAITYYGKWRYLWDRVAHLGRPQAHRRDVHHRWRW